MRGSEPYAVNGAMTDLTTLDVPSMEALRRPLRDDEKRELWGEALSSELPISVAELRSLAKSSDETTRRRAELALCRLIYESMAARMLDEKNGPAARLVKNARRYEMSLNRIFR